MSSDFDYNFGFAVEDIFELGYTISMLRHLKKNSYSESGVMQL